MPQHPTGPDDAPPEAGPFRSTADQRLLDAVRATPPRYHPGHGAAMRDVQAAVCALVDELRAQGLAPEKVLVIVKGHVATRADRPAEMIDDVVRWCIRRYYRDCTEN